MSKPSGADKEFIEKVSDIFNVPTGLKRGKDIKVFADLSPDVQVIINSMSEVDGVIDPKGKADRTQAAIMYQHLFPNRYYSVGVA